MVEGPFMCPTSPNCRRALGLKLQWWGWVIRIPKINVFWEIPGCLDGGKTFLGVLDFIKNGRKRVSPQQKEEPRTPRHGG